MKFAHIKQLIARLQLKKDGFIARDERGSTTLIAILIMALVGAFVAVAVARVTAEARMMGNDGGETRAFYAAHASLETMTRNFSKIFDYELTPSTSDLNNVQSETPTGFNRYNFNQQITIDPSSQNNQSSTVIINSGPFSGLSALRDRWILNATATDNLTLQQVHLERDFNNYRVPIFQFGVFKDWDLEFHAGPNFDFGGRVHSNGNIYLAEGNDSTLSFESKVTAVGQIVRDVMRNGRVPTGNGWSGTVQIDSTGTGNYVTLTTSSTSQSTAGSVINGPDITNSDPNQPNGSVNPQWATSDARFNGNLLSGQPKLVLPIKIGKATDNREIIKRPRNDANDYEVAVMGRPQDDLILAHSRYANGCRTGGIRISLADDKNELPGCRGVTTPCGVQLDWSWNPSTGKQDSTYNSSHPIGYKPPAMRDGYQATPFNGFRLYRGASYTDRGMPSTRDTWIKVEVVTTDPTTGAVQAQEVTSSFLSLGMTEPAPASLVGASNPYITSGTDSRSIIKLQRFVVPGTAVRMVSGVNSPTSVSGKPAYSYSSSIGSYVVNGTNYTLDGNEAQAGVTSGASTYIPFPIEMFDSREGVYNLSDTTTINGYKTNGTLPVNGVMSVIDVDVANLKKLIDGNFDSVLPTSVPSNEVPLTSALIPRIEGTMMYISDRRGDRDFDGEYDMEDVFGKYDGNIYAGEDINGSDPSANITGDGILETSGAMNCSGAPASPCVHTTNDLPYVWEGSKYIETGAWGRATDPTSYLTTSPVNAGSGNFATVNSDIAALFDHRYYRRATRLINGTQPPGGTNLPGLGTRGFTFASENGVYIKGNFNATGISSLGSPTPSQNYLPSYDLNGSTNQVPCSVVGDTISLLSNSWNDGASFGSGLDETRRVASETYVRTAVITGVTLSFLLYDSSGAQLNIPNQGGGEPGLYGGVHNTLRFLESWSGTRIHYCGSLICFYTSRNNNGTYKYPGTVYIAPIRDYTFDVSFTDPTRLPPGTPFFQYIQITGFRRTNY